VKKKSQGKLHPKSTLRTLIRAFLRLTAVFFVVTIIYALLPTKHQIICANTISCTESFKLKIENNAIGMFQNKKVIPPKIDLTSDMTKLAVLGTATGSGEKHIYVDLTKQKLTAYQGSVLYMEADVSTGKWHPTPTGDFRIWIKNRATRMAGGEGADAYDLPNVPFVMFFYNNEVPQATGFSLHGAYWHNNFGHPMSHGCVNMRITDAEKLYNWADPATTGYTTYTDSEHLGTKVTIFGEAP